ncbi:2-oxoacid:acceptor oxidoreductase family protein [Hippea maritima]|uniref:Pyruvate/ketoisovalerate oxidoreductase, gamma subunit n=1 Tax=Hippea maritima (strain ATCC 700847 / DSM 10411 / MH2) TaxID=760142 RepID=F2LUV6_HIPMA|nr:2-oxoacid:acceptor oxidoreductase family protein [Hippea maritima]AEA33561.1 pyruvate/ketoisovalerate oxidoreductase, gamma subunit [Hippea maritima DSM 10411]
MSKKMDIRWHGRAGQGAVTAAKTLAELISQEEGIYAQGFAVYGAEKRGAPVVAFTRVNDKPIRDHSEYMEPDIVLILDPTLMGLIDVKEGLKKDGKVIVNTAFDKEEVIKELGLEGYEVYVVDANKISIETLGRAIPNTPMIGALAKVTGLFSKEEVSKGVVELLEEAGKFPEKIIEGNRKAIETAYEEVK